MRRLMGKYPYAGTLKYKMNTKTHWDNVYSTKAENEVSWFQPYPNTSVAFFESFNLPLTANLIDIGGGDSRLVDVLLEKGYQNIWVLDISAKAIERAKKRLGSVANKIHWIVSDVTEFDFKNLHFDFWHDRASFHFLTTDDKIGRYVSLAKHAISKNGFLVLGTFSEQGPEKCSGLHVNQYSESSMKAKFEGSFAPMECMHQDHVTPFGTVQNFLFCCFKRI